MFKVVVLILVLSGAGCAAHVGTQAGIYVPKDAAATCSVQCHDIGLALDSVVVMANNVGCVCAAAPAARSGAPGSASGGGMAAILLQEQEEEQARKQTQQSTSTSPSYR